MTWHELTVRDTLRITNHGDGGGSTISQKYMEHLFRGEVEPGKWVLTRFGLWHADLPDVDTLTASYTMQACQITDMPCFFITTDEKTDDSTVCCGGWPSGKEGVEYELTDHLHVYHGPNGDVAHFSPISDAANRLYVTSFRVKGEGKVVLISFGEIIGIDYTDMRFSDVITEIEWAAQDEIGTAERHAKECELLIQCMMNEKEPQKEIEIMHKESLANIRARFFNDR